MLRSGDLSTVLSADRGGFGGDITWNKVLIRSCGAATDEKDVVVSTRYDDVGGTDTG